MEDGVEHPILRAASFYKSLLSVGKGEFLQYPDSREDINCCWGTSEDLGTVFSCRCIAVNPGEINCWVWLVAPTFWSLAFHSEFLLGCGDYAWKQITWTKCVVNLLGMTLGNCLDVSGLQVWSNLVLDSQVWGLLEVLIVDMDKHFLSSVQKGISRDKCYFGLLGCDIPSHQDLKPSMCS